MKPFITILTGPTCAGKSTLEAMLRKQGFASLVSTTTRSPRFGEVDGQHYYFVDRARFIAMKEAGDMVEAVEFGGNLYGVSRAEVMRVAANGQPIVVVVEPQGRQQIIDFCERNDWAYHAVYVGNPDEVIAKRFLTRLNNELEGVKNHVGVIARYAERMREMMTIERAWVIEAYFQGQSHNDGPYDRILFQFDENNDGAVVAGICEEARYHKAEQERLAA